MKYNIDMRSHLFLAFWLVGIVSPAIWLRQFLNSSRQAFDTPAYN